MDPGIDQKNMRVIAFHGFVGCTLPVVRCYKGFLKDPLS
jgi:hypothetical protein